MVPAIQPSPPFGRKPHCSAQDERSKMLCASQSQRSHQTTPARDEATSSRKNFWSYRRRSSCQRKSALKDDYAIMWHAGEETDEQGTKPLTDYLVLYRGKDAVGKPDTNDVMAQVCNAAEFANSVSASDPAKDLSQEWYTAIGRTVIALSRPAVSNAEQDDQLQGPENVNLEEVARSNADRLYRREQTIAGLKDENKALHEHIKFQDDTLEEANDTLMRLRNERDGLNETVATLQKALQEAQEASKISPAARRLNELNDSDDDADDEEQQASYRTFGKPPFNPVKVHVLGLDGTIRRRFEVDKDLLRESSRYFFAMLKPRVNNYAFQESSAKTISFKGDNPKDWLIFLGIIHLRDEDIPDTLTYKELKSFTKFVDKYDLGPVAAANGRCGAWLHSNLQGPYEAEELAREPWEALNMSFAFQDQRLFERKRTQLAIEVHASDDQLFWKETCLRCTSLSERDLEHLEQLRRQFFQALVDAMRLSWLSLGRRIEDTRNTPFFDRNASILECWKQLQGSSWETVVDRALHALLGEDSFRVLKYTHNPSLNVWVDENGDEFI